MKGKWLIIGMEHSETEQKFATEKHEDPQIYSLDLLPHTGSNFCTQEASPLEKLSPSKMKGFKY